MNIDPNRLDSLAKQYEISSLYLFGSFARGDFTDKSDVDLLVKFKNSPGYFGFIRIEEKLSELFGRKVDLVTESAISKYIRENVVRDAKEIYYER